MKSRARTSTPPPIQRIPGTHQHPPEDSPNDPLNDAAGESDEPSDLDDLDPATVATSDDDGRWDVFIGDEDEIDPQPEPDDFGESWEQGAWSEEPD